MLWRARFESSEIFNVYRTDEATTVSVLHIFRSWNAGSSEGNFLRLYENHTIDASNDTVAIKPKDMKRGDTCWVTVQPPLCADGCW